MLGRDINVPVPPDTESPNGGDWDFARYAVLFPDVNNPPCEDGEAAAAAPPEGTVHATVANSFKAGLQNLGAESAFRPRKIMSSYFLLKWGVQILCLFNQNQTPRLG